MGELLDKLERASRGAATPLGFASAVKREKIAPMLLLGALAAGDAAGAKLASDGVLDGAIVVGTGGANKADVERSVAALDGVTFGIWLDEAQPGQTAPTLKSSRRRRRPPGRSAARAARR
ncbi:MAG: hypothetical protein IH869_05955 [Chloroflexi bacterium]|nr:hypothetical protein [Chloroflexota bacterium]